jgi:phosphomevalonate kinase
VIATAPGKLILTGEYAVLDGAPALVIAVNRRVVAARRVGPRGSSPFLAAVADELAARGRRDAAAVAMTIAVDSRSFYDAPRPGLAPVKLGLGSSAAITVAATALALGEPLDRDLVLDVAAAAHARAQQMVLQPGAAAAARATRISGSFAVPSAGATLVETAEPTFQPSGTDPGFDPAANPGEFSAEGTQPGDDPTTGEPSMRARRRHSITASPIQGSGADVACAVLGGVLSYTLPARGGPPVTSRRELPRGVTLIPFFTGVSADTRQLVAAVTAARTTRPVEIGAALTAIAEASRAASQSCDPASRALRLGADDHLAANAFLGALALAGRAIDALAAATQLALVPPCVSAVRAGLARMGGVAKTTGAGGGDVAIAALPVGEDATAAIRCIIEAGGKPLALTVDNAGVDLRPDAA